MTLFTKFFLNLYIFLLEDSNSMDETAYERMSESPDLEDLGCALKADRILGATLKYGQLMYVIKWKGSFNADVVTSKLANAKWPQVVIQFYEERMTWTK